MLSICRRMCSKPYVVASAFFLVEGLWAATAGFALALEERWWLRTPSGLAAGIGLVGVVTGLNLLTAWLIWRRTHLGFVVGILLSLLFVLPIPVPTAEQVPLYAAQAIFGCVALAMLVIDRERFARNGKPGNVA